MAFQLLRGSKGGGKSDFRVKEIRLGIGGMKLSSGDRVWKKLGRWKW
jgi:hypothetical protein